MSYVSDLNKVVGVMNYQGCLITPDKGGYVSLGKWHKTLKEAKETIRKSTEWVEIEKNVFVTKEYYDKTYNNAIKTKTTGRND